MTARHEVVIVGGGPAGSAAALHLLQAGVVPALVEADAFPRFHIGESLSGDGAQVLRRLDLASRLDATGHPFKRATRVWGPRGVEAFQVPVMARNAQGALEAARTWQVRRSDFDRTLLDEAVRRGARLVLGRAVAPLLEAGRVRGVRAVTPQGNDVELRSEVVVDASGHKAFLANSPCPTGTIRRGVYDRMVAVFSQVKGAERDPGAASGNTHIFYRRRHHWAWFIPLDDELVSVGVVTPGQYFQECGVSKQEFLAAELQTLNPELARRVQDRKFFEPARGASNYSYEVERFVGEGFVCVGDSHRFVDPIFSFGVNIALRESEIAARAIVAHLEARCPPSADPFAAYRDASQRAQDLVQDLVDVFWAAPLPFAALVHRYHREDMIDVFAGRVFDPRVQASEGVQALREIKAAGATRLDGTA